jgi:hypothetical protein
MSHWDTCEHCRANFQEPPGVVHIYGQHSWHGEAYIVADEKGLTLVRDAINRALAEGQAHVGLSPADGEGFLLYVVKHDTERMDKLTLPYPEHPGSEKTHRPPYSIVKEPTDGVEDEILGDDEWFEFMRRTGMIE